MVPAQDRPVGATFPSFMRVVSSSASTGAMSSTRPVSGSMATKPSRTAATSPPDALSATAPIIRPTGRISSSPVRGSVRWTVSPTMSTHHSTPPSASQTGPSPRPAAAFTTSSARSRGTAGRGSPASSLISLAPLVHCECEGIGRRRAWSGRLMAMHARGPGDGRPVKLVAIGIGSVIFGVELLRDVFRVPEFRGAELWLVDLDPGALGRMARLAERLNEAAGWDVSVHSTPDRTDALPDADFVVTAVAIDRLRSWRTDHELALKHGFASVLSENGGPGGLSHTLRSVPLMVEIARDIERLAPAALLLNYTNPANRVCLAVSRHTTVQTIGLCHSVAGQIDDCAQLLGRNRADLVVHAAGSNHFTWFLSIRDATDGTDLMPEFKRRTIASDSTEPLVRLITKRLGVRPAIGDDHIG